MPVIETRRLRLRGPRRDDLPQCVAMWSDPIVKGFIAGMPSGEQRTSARVLAHAGHWVLSGFGYWAIEERETSTFVGAIGFADCKRDGAPLRRTGPELGFARAPSFHGKGYTTEAVRAALAWGNEWRPRGRCMCLVDEENAASLHALGNVGSEVLQRSALNGLPVIYRSTPTGTQR